jgi:hypothetical protein
MFVPILASLHAVAAADAFGGIEQDTARLAVSKSGGWNQIAVLLSQRLGRRTHGFPFSRYKSLTGDVYHFRFTTVNRIFSIFGCDD